MKNKKRNKIFLLLILLLGISIGFAALATTLKINGSATITKNTWNIYWDNIANEDGVTPETETIIESEDANHPNNIVTFEVEFDKPGDYYEFEVDAVNAGTLDAEILSIEKKYNDTVIPEVEDPNNRVVPAYLKYEVKYANDTLPTIGDGLAKAQDLTSNPPVYTTKTYKIRVEYDRDAVTNADINNQVENVTHEFSFKVDYGQATPAPSAVDFSTDSWDIIASEGNRAATQETVTDGCCGTYHVGDTREVDLGDLGVHTVRIANCSTPAVCSTEEFSQTACGFVLEFTDLVTKRRMNPFSYNVTNGIGSVGSWEYSDIRAYLNSGIYANENINYSSTGLYSKFPENLKPLVDDTQVVSGYVCLQRSGNTCTEQGNGGKNHITSDKLYLLDLKEIYGLPRYTENTSLNSERQLDYYNGIGVTDSNYLAVKKSAISDESSYYWWLRTPYNSRNTSFSAVEDTGYLNYYRSDNAYGISPAFKLK